MANRRAHKKLRREIRERMARTGESYQKARDRILSCSAPALRTDLIEVSYFGRPAALATIEMHGMTVSVLVPSAHLWSRGHPTTSPASLLRAAMRAKGGIQ